MQLPKRSVRRRKVLTRPAVWTAQDRPGTLAPGPTVCSFLPRLSDFVSHYLIADFIMKSACRTGTSGGNTIHHLFHALDAQGEIFAADCATAALRLIELRSRLPINQSSSMK